MVKRAEDYRGVGIRVKGVEGLKGLGFNGFRAGLSQW